MGDASSYVYVYNDDGKFKTKRANGEEEANHPVFCSSQDHEFHERIQERHHCVGCTRITRTVLKCKNCTLALCKSCSKENSLARPDSVRFTPPLHGNNSVPHSVLTRQDDGRIRCQMGRPRPIEILPSAVPQSVLTRQPDGRIQCQMARPQPVVLLDRPSAQQYQFVPVMPHSQPVASQGHSAFPQNQEMPRLLEKPKPKYPEGRTIEFSVKKAGSGNDISKRLSVFVNSKLGAREEQVAHVRVMNSIDKAWVVLAKESLLNEFVSASSKERELDLLDGWKVTWKVYKPPKSRTIYHVSGVTSSMLDSPAFCSNLRQQIVEQLNMQPGDVDVVSKTSTGLIEVVFSHGEYDVTFNRTLFAENGQELIIVPTSATV